MRLATERNARLRLNRLARAAADRARQRGRPTQPTMRALTVMPGGRFRWQSAPAPPPPGPRGAIVHPIAIATCDLDPAIALGASPFPLPLHLGHECVAEVLAVGDAVEKFSARRRVVVPFQVSCGTCAACRSGRTGNCTTVPPISMYGMGAAGGHWGGAYSDQIAVPFADAMLVALPEGLDPAAVASVADNVSDGYRHVAPHLPELLERDRDAEVIILSATNPRSMFSSSVGLYAGLVAGAIGAGRVFYAHSRADVLDHAARLGLNAVHPRDLKDVSPAPLVVDASGDPSGLGVALSRVAPDGICSSVGGIHATAKIPVLSMYAHNVTLHVGRTHVRTLIPQVLDLITDSGLKPEAVTTMLAPLDDAPASLREHFLGGGTKAVLTA
jgi:alcohol dehydrogenase